MPGAYARIDGRVFQLSFHPLPFPFISLSSPSFSLPVSTLFYLPVPPLPLEVRPLKQAKGPGEHFKLPQRDPGQSLGRKRIWCTLELSESHMVEIILSILKCMFYSRSIII